MEIHSREGWKEGRKSGPPPPTRSVLFVDNSAGGVLARMFQEAEQEAGATTGYRIRMTESAGTHLSRLLPSTNPWGPQACGRADCVTCHQGDERRIDCKKRNILYESECTVCMENDKDGVEKDGKGVYVGESSRSIYERAKEHTADRVGFQEDSHQKKHWLSSHEELLAPPAFKFKIISTFQDPLSRQLSGAVRIDRRGSQILNSKSEYSRCRVPRLRIDKEGWMEKVEKGGKDEKKMESQITDAVSSQEEGMNLLDTGDVNFSEAELSIGEQELKRKNETQKGRKSKRRRMERLEGWGLSEEIQGDTEASRDILEEESGAEAMNTMDWVAERVMHVPGNLQTDISNWVKINPGVPDDSQMDENLPEGRKIKDEVKQSRRRQTGKLTKKELEKMKQCHNDISTMMVKKKKETIEEELVETEAAKAEDDLEKEERLERVRRKAKEWKVWHFCKDVMMDVMEDVMEMMDMKMSVAQPVVEILNKPEDKITSKYETDPEFDNKPKNMIMQAVHTPLLGPRCTQDIQWDSRHTDNHRAGNNVLETTGTGVQSGADMKKLLDSHRSPKVLISYDKTPTVINDQVEMFGDIQTMIKHWDSMEENEKEEDILATEVVGDGGKHKRLSEVVQRLSKVFEGEEMARNDVPDIGCIKGEGDDVKQLKRLKNGAPAKSVCVGAIKKTNNAYIAVLKSKEFSINEKPDITSSIKHSVSTNGRAGGTETRKIGGSYYPVRLPGNLGR